MRKIVLAMLVIAAAYFGYGETGKTPPAAQFAPAPANNSAVAANSSPVAFDHRHAGRQVQGQGVVKKILPDDNKGSRHQRFILRLQSGQTILVAHNIDLAPRVGSIKPGDIVEFYGVYETNDLGGVVHWTHHDPGGRHEDGWLKHNGKLFQ